ncbi:MAG TPA: hypothetical protein VLL77_12260 [Anaerolineales bacterium]|nr:hypothetical protein [Anaerolineales bacterium]
MKILALSDQVVPYVYSPEAKDRFRDVDLIAGCGDLPASYLEYVVSVLNTPMVYVPGNHDPDGYHVQGGVDLDASFARIRSLAMFGLGGSPRYKELGEHQHTELGMLLRALPLLPRLVLRRFRFGHGADLLIAHAPPRGIHDDTDPAHRGFQTFRRVIQWVRPRLMLHGHCHIWADLAPRETILDGCRILNIYPVQVVDLEAR